MSSDIAGLRREYMSESLDEKDVHGDPIEQFRRWFDQALNAGTADPNAMTLATASPDGRPSARIMLLKGFDEHGFVFYTNYESRKGEELGSNPQAALVFYWNELNRQVRIEGRTSRVDREESERYFCSRPRESQIGAWASTQSRVLGGRPELESGFAAALERFAQREVDCPPQWGGYLLRPERFEFWQGRPSRLHDRLCYDAADGGWQIGRLAP
jgi:pyridoxamine 5'-phosphate oxidase